MRVFGNQRRGTITFICPDPYAYGPEIPYTFPSDYVSVTNEGTHESKPVFELEVLTPVTFAMIQNQHDEYMMIGSPIDVETKTYQKYERIFYSDCNTLTGWSTGNTGEVDGVISGQMAVREGTRFQPSDYGAGTKVWHGPAVKTSLPETVQDFRMQAFVSLYNETSADLLGRVYISLLDVNGNMVATVGMHDASARTANMYGVAKAGSLTDFHSLIYEYGDKRGNWNDFSGILRIQREGNHWYAYFAKVTNGRHHTRRWVNWTDYENKYSNKVAQVAIHIAKYDNYPHPHTLGVYSVSVDKINQPINANEIDTPFIAGDIITFDHKDKVILVNGEARKDLKQFGASYFGLEPGENKLTVAPFDSFNITTKYRETFK